MIHTLINLLQLGDDVESNLWELVLEHEKEHGQQVIDSPLILQLAEIHIALLVENVLLLAQNRGQAANLSTESSTHML